MLTARGLPTIEELRDGSYLSKTEERVMALSNGERQRRFITRLKERADAGDVTNEERVKELQKKLRSAQAEIKRLKKRLPSAK
jgi:uncharacterized membrane protein